MATCEIQGDEVVVGLGGWEKAGAMRGDLRFPLTSVRSARKVEAASRELRGWRAPGTGLPGVVALGTWRKRGAKDFVAAYRRHPGFVLELDGQSFDRLVLSGDLPTELEHLTAS